MAALRRRDIDLAGRLVVVRRAQAELQDGRLFDKAPKSAAGVRTVSFPGELVDEITRHLEHYAAAGQDGHVCVGPQGGQLRRSNFRDDWVKARKDAGVTAELHFHDLRHTGNTLASTAGASTRELMTRMGHSSSRVALIYQHMTSDRDRAPRRDDPRRWGRPLGQRRQSHACSDAHEMALRDGPTSGI
ncbi:tyrosine-type recombinase/integrase [Streptomyces sp. NPDC090798]|uniref:tyrosine-type recombinase/integrase n=1 Tax=Streptomyces sp. NPDC090798 TaxID=3365968 RepID=UPI0037F2AB2A